MNDFTNKLMQLRWAIKFRRRFRTPCAKPAIALMVNGMERGGLEQVVMDLYYGYKARGYRVYIVCATWQIDTIKDKLDAVEDVFVYQNDFDALIQFLWRRDIRTLHYHFSVFCIRILHLMGFQTLYTMHNLYTFMDDGQIHAYAKKLEAADWLVPVAPVVDDYFRERTQYRGKNIKVILDGVNFGHLDGGDEELQIDREQLGIHQNDIVLGMVASFYHVKHQIGMIGVMERLLERYPNVKLVIMGAYGDVNYHTQFDKMLAVSPAQSAIIVAPFIPHQMMGAFYRRVMDIFVLPSMREGFGMVSVEAMYCAKPLVLTPTGAGEMLIHQGAGVLADCPYNNLNELSDAEILRLSALKDAPNRDSLVSAISEIIDHLDEYKLKAEQCRGNALQYSTDHMVDGYVKLLKTQ